MLLKKLLDVALVEPLLVQLGHLVLKDEFAHRFPIVRGVPLLDTAVEQSLGSANTLNVLILAVCKQSRLHLIHLRVDFFDLRFKVNFGGLHFQINPHQLLSGYRGNCSFLCHFISPFGCRNS